jgi:arylsulfatase A-like enzyme
MQPEGAYLMVSAIRSYWQVFRLIFVLFFLYLIGDIFYRWDGFSYYAPFSDFVPGVALITTLWGFIAFVTAAIIWGLSSVMEWLFTMTRWKIKKEHILLFLAFFVPAIGTAWLSKQHIYKFGSILHGKLVIFLIALFVALFFSWLIRHKTLKLLALIQYRITSLVWLFSIWFIVSVPITGYYTWIKSKDNSIKQIVSHSVSTEMPRPNILFITFDALTARDMSLYGYDRPTTPFLDSFAKTATVFTRMKAASNYTKSTLPSLMTGKRVWSHQIYHSEQDSMPANIKTENLPLLLKNYGYYNIAIMTSPESSVRGLFIKEFFDVAPQWTEFNQPVTLLELMENSLYSRFGDKIVMYDWLVKEDFIMSKLLKRISTDDPEISRRPNLAFNKFINVLDNIPTKPYFAWIHIFPPHYPYSPPEPFSGMFGPSSDASLRELEEVITSKDSAFKQDALEAFRTRYDENIRYCDSQFEDFLLKLRAANKLQNTIIIVSSDHGENFDHGLLKHCGPDLYELVTHIPLIIKEPGQTEGHVIHDLAGQIDIPATILELAGIPVPSWMEGRSLIPLLRGNSMPSRPIFTMNFESNRSLGTCLTKGTVAVWKDDYKIMHYLEQNRSMLFNLSEDPGELVDLSDTKINVAHQLFSLIHKELNKANDKITHVN